MKDIFKGFWEIVSEKHLHTSACHLSFLCFNKHSCSFLIGVVTVRKPQRWSNKHADVAVWSVWPELGARLLIIKRAESSATRFSPLLTGFGHRYCSNTQHGHVNQLYHVCVFSPGNERMLLKRSTDWFAVWQPSQRCRHCNVKCLRLGEEYPAGNQTLPLRCSKVKMPKIGMNYDRLYFPSLESWNNIRSQRNFFKGFWLFYWGISFLSAIVHKAYIIYLRTICGSLGIALETIVFDLPPIRVLAGGIFDAFLVFFPLFFVLAPAFLPLHSARNRFFRVLIHVRKWRNGRGLRRLSQL